jgi:hypothetical protein
MTDIVEDLRAECLAAHGMPVRPDGPTDEELRVLESDPKWLAAGEIERLRDLAAGWQPIHTAPKDGAPVLLFVPKLEGHVAREVVVGVWRFDANRRSFGYWVSDVGTLDGGFAETGPWIEYVELKPEMWAPLLQTPNEES